MSDESEAAVESAPLESWKSIAAYLRRDVRTVVRWEKHEGLPVHRHRHRARSTVYAFPHELDVWRANRVNPPVPGASGLGKSTARLAIASLVFIAVSVCIADRLPGRTPGTTLSDRRIDWPGDTSDVEDTTMSPTGRYIGYLETSGRGLAIRDLQTGVTQPLGRRAHTPVFSRDERQIAYVDDDGPSTLRILPLPALRPDTGRRLASGPDVILRDWSPDGRDLLVTVGDEAESDETDIALVNVGDGTTKIVKHAVAGLSSPPRLSPDGRYIAFDARPDPRDRQLALFVISSDGDSETPILTGPGSESVVGWSPDGRNLVFTSDSTGVSGLWTVPMRDGRPAGRPVLVRRGFRGLPRTMISSGALVYQQSPEAAVRAVLYTASIDREVPAAPGRVALAAHDRESFNRFPRWAADGKSFLYITSRAEGPVISIRSIDRTETREIPLPLDYVWSFDWSPNGRQIAFRGIDLRRRWGTFVFDLTTRQLLTVDPGSSADRYVYGFPQFSRDGRALSLFRVERKASGEMVGTALVSHDIVSGAERIELPDLRGFLTRREPLGRSPDHRFLLAAEDGTSPSRLLVYDTITNGIREVFAAQPARAFDIDDGVQWTPDSRAIVANVREGQGTRRLWWIPVDGGNPYPLDLGVPNVSDSAIAIHPDGRQLAFLAGDPIWHSLPLKVDPNFMGPNLEFRLLEHFLPH
jgi:Tol biopolymer transport system component